MDELEEKQRRLLTLIEERGLDAVCLSRVANFAWYTGGLEPVVMLSSDRAEASLVIERDRRMVVCNSVEQPRLRDEDRLADQGYEFCVSPWHESASKWLEAMRDKRWGADWPWSGAIDLSAEIARLRYRLTSAEVERYRALGGVAAGAIERVARAVLPGMTERHIAGLLGAEALKAGVTPTLLLVGADERVFRYRHPIPTAKPVERHCMLVICGRQSGLVASATRLVHFGRADAELLEKQDACAAVDAAFNDATRVGARVGDVFARGVRAYADAGYPGEWKKHNQGGAAGYESRDYEGTPTSTEIVLAEQAFAWNPSITGTKSEDTMIVHEDGPEFLTVTGDWPTVSVDIAGQTWERPSILFR